MLNQIRTAGQIGDHQAAPQRPGRKEIASPSSGNGLPSSRQPSRSGRPPRLDPSELTVAMAHVHETLLTAEGLARFKARWFD